MKTIQVKLGKKDMEKAQNFADLRCSQSQDLYKKRGGFKRDDIVIGALAELAVYKLLRKHGYKVSKPDFKLHEKKKKSYDADLTDLKNHFHVKGQSLESAQKYGESWLFQRYDKLVQEAELNHYVVPCVVSLVTGVVTIYGILSSYALHTKIKWGECSVPMFRKTKVALYAKDFSNISNKTRWRMITQGSTHGGIKK